MTIVQFLPLILWFFLLAGPSCAGEVSGKKLDMHDLTGVLKQAAEREKSIFLPESQAAGPSQDAAEALMKQYQTPEYQAKIKAEQQRLQKTVFKEVLAEFAPQDKHNDSVGKFAGDERVYLFFSSSVPLSTLRSYAMMIDRAGDPNVVMVLRGFVGGMKRIKPTMEFIGKVLKKNPACETSTEKCEGYNVGIQVDPELFQRYQVHQVPTVVYASGLPQGEMTEIAEEESTQQSFTIQGDAGLDWLLEQINREAKKESLAGLMALLRDGNNGRNGNR